MEIRAERSEDRDPIRRITKAAFASIAHSDQTEAAIVDALRNTGALTHSMVAVLGDDIVGHVAISPVTVDGEHRGWYGLGPVSVRPDRQKQGIGSKLIRESLAELERAGAEGCVVLGDSGFYSRFGFANDSGLRFEAAPPEYFMRLAFAGPVPAGRVDYHPAFGAAGLHEA